MKLNHLDLQVPDVVATAALFEEMLALRIESNRASPAIAILSDGHGFTLVLQRRSDEQPFPEGFHFGFLVDAVDAVRAFRAKAHARGLDVSDVIENGRGTLCYWRVAGLLVEVSRQRPR